MVGFGLEGYEERIPCPRCGSTDCCGIKEDKRGRQYLICSRTGKRVTAKMLEESAKKHGLKKKPFLHRFLKAKRRPKVFLPQMTKKASNKGSNRYTSFFF